MNISLDAVQIRTIQPKDNEPLALIIRRTLEEFGANKPGTVYYDTTTDALFELFQIPNAVYYVAEANNHLLGGGGIFPSNGLPAKTCELVKMYLVPEARGIGLGKLLIEKCLHFTKSAGYWQVYIETMPELKQALKTYEKFGFEYLDKPLGNTGHTGCDMWMLKQL